MHLGRSLKVALARANMNQTQLAAKLRLSPRWVNKIANQPGGSMQTIQLLADAFSMKPSDFIKLGED